MPYHCRLCCRATIGVALITYVCVALNAPSARGDEPEAGESDASHLPFAWYIPGTVEDENGERVAGAKVQTVRAFATRRSTTSDENGRFVLSFRSDVPHPNALIATSEHGTHMGYVERVEHSARQLNRIVLKPTRDITVIVRDEQRRPSAGATVGVIADYSLIDTATADEHGSVALHLPADAKIDWFFAYLADTGFDYYENYAAFPTQERLTPPDAIALTLNGSRNVVVRAVDTDQKPVAKVAVTPWTIQKQGKLSYINLSGLRHLGTTDEAGNATFSWIPADLQHGVTFLVRHPKYHCPQPPRYESDDSDMTARLLKVATVRGKVTRADGSPVAGIRLQGEGRGDTNHYFRGHTMTRKDGTYEFDIYPEQATIIAVTENAHAAKSHTDIRLKEGETQEDVDFVLGDGTLIHGTITLGTDRQPAVGDTATLIQTAGGTDLVRWSKTDEDGKYRFRVGPGTYELRLPNAESSSINLQITDEAEVVHDGHAERRARVTLNGTVVDENDTPVAACDVYGESIASPGHAGFRTTTDGDGNFSTERWSDDMVVYVLQGEQQLAGYTKISEDATEVTVKLAPAATATGVVRDASGQPVANAQVMLNLELDLAEAGRGITLTTPTDKQGRYVFSGLSPGVTCSVNVYRANQHTGGPSFDVTSVAPIEVDDVVINDAENAPE